MRIYMAMPLTIAEYRKDSPHSEPEKIGGYMQIIPMGHITFEEVLSLIRLAIASVLFSACYLQFG